MKSAAVKKKIVWLAHEANLSGANIALLEYADKLNDEYDFHFIVPHRGNMMDVFKQKNYSASVVHQYGWAVPVNEGKLKNRFKIVIRSFIAVIQTCSIIRKQKASFVFTNSQVSFTASIAAKIMHRAHVWWIHEFGEEDFGFRIGWGNQQRAFRKMQKWSRLIICNSEAVTNKFRLLMSAVDVKRLYQPVSWHPKLAVVQEMQSKYLMFGQITPSKGHLEVLLALVELKEKKKSFSVSLHIKGPCENKAYLDELLQFIQQHQLQEQVKIKTGFFQKEEVMPLYEVLIVASQSEAFGRVIVEANKAGLRVIVKNSGGAPELINETNGLLYNDVMELAAILGGEKPMPVVAVRQNYDEQEEIHKLKNWLAKC